ncbi:lanthionine synthetase C family protein [Streptomyces anthocyanicus]|uniref:lanthionine synthetase C family protein n=1 Tax=Streptomyces anthocyanicus TaxID=68174 RepID=UPI002F91438B|nr:lanthionine synthetase C family protein [Streptomyces anthocyanicus]
MTVPRYAAEARDVATQVFGRLADPVSTAADTCVVGDPVHIRLREPLWQDLALSSGYPGVSLAFMGRGTPGPVDAARGHAYLVRALHAVAATAHQPGGIYVGPGAVAFAVLVAHRATGDYEKPLRQLDDYQRRLIRRALPEIRETPTMTNGEFEVVRGMSGIGRYLLARRDHCDEELRFVLSYLTRMAHGDIAHRGHRVPRWWTWAAPKLGQEVEMPDGHLNLGLSHGVAGPLALLSLAWQQGAIVEGQREAIERLVALLRHWTYEGVDGPLWPPHLTLEAWEAGPDAPPPRHRPSWCYGAPGVSRAVQLAGLALGRDDWLKLAHRSLMPLLTSDHDSWNIDNANLCHGWSGMMHLLAVLNESIKDERLADLIDDMAARTLAQFHPEYRFGFRAPLTNCPEGTDVPAFVEGAAGTALALDAYADGRTTTQWNMALLLA